MFRKSFPGYYINKKNIFFNRIEKGGQSNENRRLTV